MIFFRACHLWGTEWDINPNKVAPHVTGKVIASLADNERLTESGKDREGNIAGYSTVRDASSAMSEVTNQTLRNLRIRNPKLQ